MCGIAGYYCFGDKRPEPESIRKFFLKTSTRGTDATGYMFPDPKEASIRYFKHPIPAATFIKFPIVRDMIETKLPKVFVLHCRAKTQGDPRVNKNNHPVCYKGVCIVHNGIIHNDAQLFQSLKLRREAQVDSEIIAAILSLHLRDGWQIAIKELAEAVTGSFAVVALATRNLSQLAVFRRSSPLELGIDRTNDILYFASTREILKESLSIDYRGFLLPRRDIQYLSLKDDSVCIFDSEGLHDEFEIPTRTWLFDYRSHQHNPSQGAKEIDAGSLKDGFYNDYNDGHIGY